MNFHSGHLKLLVAVMALVPAHGAKACGYSKGSPTDEACFEGNGDRNSLLQSKVAMTSTSEEHTLQVSKSLQEHMAQVSGQEYPPWSRKSPSFPRFKLQTNGYGLVENTKFEVDEQEIYIRVVKPTDKVLSLGGNVGFGCTLVNKLLNDPTQQLCVEPNPEIHQLLEGNRNRTSSQFQIVKGAITESTENMVLEVYQGDPQRLGSSIVVNGSLKSGHVVQKFPMAYARSLLSSTAAGIPATFDALLADCEGCLCPFLREYPSILQEVRTVAFEADGSDSQCYKDLEDNLRTLGFTFHGCTGGQFRAWVRTASVRADTSPEIAMLEPSPDCGIQAPERTAFYQTLDNSQNTPKSYWASYLKQAAPQPQLLEGELSPSKHQVIAHTYWHGDFGPVPALCVKSFLVTQNPSLTRLVIWLDAQTPNLSPVLRTLQAQANGRAEVRVFDYKTEVVNTPMEGKWEDLQSAGRRLGKTKWPVKESTDSDLVRYLVLYKYGGLWFDTDVMFLRDLSPILPYEWAYPWDKLLPHGEPNNHTLNGALMRLFPGSAANHDMISRVVKDRVPFGLWGLTSMKDNTRHKDLRIVDVELLDPLWKDVVYADPANAALYSKGPDKTYSRFGHFFSSDAHSRLAFLNELIHSRALTYHWHNHWTTSPQVGSAFRLYEGYFDCMLAHGNCGKLGEALQAPST